MPAQQKITPFLWYDGDAEEAVDHYVSIFREAKVLSVVRCGDVGPGPKGSVLTIQFQLEGQQFVALNGGPQFRFTEAISLMVNCTTQAEIDALWSKLSDGGEESQCGWLKDRYGLSWQITPAKLLDMLRDPDPARAARVMQAMLPMRKLDLARLEAAYRGD
jgi:predicted 3-demethylubiquinone-9 3-methyltransferase (glyoxalase superfamily)